MAALRTPRAQLLALVMLAAALIGAGLGWRQPMTVDEERFLGVALEMLQRGDWFIPHRAGQIYPDKPPLFMWAVALFTRLTGAPALALFLPALIAGMVATACLYDLGRRLWGRRAGWAAALVFLSTYQTYSVLRAGQIDGLLCLWIVLGLYGLARHLLLGPAWRWFYLACAAIGCGVISKGVGFLPLLLLVPHAWAVRQGWTGVARIPANPAGWLWGAAVLLAAIGLWLAPLVVEVATGANPQHAYLADILLRQTAARYAGAWDHREPFWYFLVAVVPKYWLPLVVALPWLVPAWRRQLAKRDGRYLVLLGWVALVLLFFSLSSGKRKLYIYPALPALALAVAPLVPWLLRRWCRGDPRRYRLWRVLVACWLAAWLAKGLFDPWREGANPHRALMAAVADRTGGAELVLVGWREGHWLFARQPLVHFGFNTPWALPGAVGWLAANPGAYALVPGADLAPCFRPEAAQPVGETSRAQWFLVGADALTGRCAGEQLPPYRFRWRTPLQ